MKNKKTTKKNALIKKGASVKDMIDVLDNAIEEINSVPKPSLVTQGYEIGIDTHYGAISQHNTKRGLIKAYGHILNEELKYTAAVAKMGLTKKTAPKLLISGFSPDQWKDDLMSRYEYLDRIENLEKLEAARSEFQKNLTKEERLQDSINIVSDILKK
jgi:hypothetical protein